MSTPTVTTGTPGERKPNALRHGGELRNGSPLRYQSLLGAYRASRESLIPILQAVQESEGYVSRESISAISGYLDLPESKVFGVATFYNQFRLSAPGRHQVQICRGTACHVKGSLSLLEVLQQELGIEAGQTTRDGMFSLETVACLGACSIAPVMTVNGEFFGRLDKKAVIRALEEIRAREAAGQPGPQASVGSAGAGSAAVPPAGASPAEGAPPAGAVRPGLEAAKGGEHA